MNQPMNSKLREQLLRLMRYSNTLTPHKLDEPLDPFVDYALSDTEKAIRQAVGEEMLALKPNNPYKTTDGQVPESFEAPSHAYDVANGDWEQKIKEWAAHQGDI